ncbi:ABC transporter ATP-binding protein [Pelagibaculum spongiae]|uniref:ABC transporter ATP-binding protein n=1 Tax=Pelagibaculum spongiae TaxID=2080658 RepID=A0A2V1GZE7_9GAMM|nr:ABC transporter transmembrane domain-containing protein [Pelagibaculum spongiae]PVZ71809.1 ABC transporter ATP-binding protein [Pelagibaculum spongiae]
MSTNQQLKPNHADKKHGAFKLLTSYIWRDRPLLTRAVTFLLLATVADVVGPMLAKIFIDDYLLPKNFESISLILLLSAYLISQFAAAWFRYQQTMRFTDIALEAVQDIRKKVFAHVLKLPMAYFDKAMTGQLVSRITNDTESIKDLYVQFLSVVIGNVVFLAGILIAMALLNVQLMLAALALIPAVICVIYLYEKFSGAAVQEARELRSDINGRVSESISGMTVLQASNQQQRFSDQFSKVNQGYYLARMKTIRASGALLRPMIDLLSVLVLLAIVWIFSLQVVSGVAEIGVLYAFLSYLGRFTEPLAEITQRFNLYQQAMVAGERVNRLMQAGEQTWHQNSSQSSGQTEAEITKGKICVEKLNFAYHPDKPILKDLNFQVNPGQFYAVVGHTGSGKSTLLSLLLNFYSANENAICFDDQPIEQFGHDSLRAGIGLIPQEPFIIAGSIGENIDMGRKLPQQQIEKAAKQAHLHSMISRLPNGYQTELGERGTRLSTGQRQQLVIARALAASPRILLLDEATANVDSETEQVVQRALMELHGQVSMIMVAHRLSTIKHADNILVLSHGEIVESGNHQQLMQLDDGLYRSMYQLQQQAAKVEAAS